jgi:prefoldin alpha subunit
MDEELTRKFQEFEIEIRQIQEQLQVIEQTMQDMNIISSGLEELKGKTGEEIMAPIGKGIFVKAKLLSENLTVNVGSEKFVKKSIDETKELIEKQRMKLRETKADLDQELEKINEEITQEMVKYQEREKKEDSEDKK